MRTFAILAVTLVVGELGGASALAQDASTKPVRHLVYNVDVGVETKQDLTNYYGHMNSGKGSIAGFGTITADVVGFGEDGALVVRVSEASDTRKAAPATVAVLSDGKVAIDPKSPGTLNEEEQALVGLLGRALVADHQLGPGEQWQVTTNSKGGSDVATYRVISLADDDKVNVDLQRQISVGGAQPMQITITGKFLYNYKLSVPLSATLKEHVVISTMEAQNTSDLAFQYNLKEDSMSTAAASPATATAQPAATPSP